MNEPTTKRVTQWGDWQPGDRVYCIARPKLTGTVTDVAGCGDLRARVAWDSGSSSWVAYEDLEYYTLPPAAQGAAVDAVCAECGSTRESVQRDAELMEEAQGFPLPDAPICCEVLMGGAA